MIRRLNWAILVSFFFALNAMANIRVIGNGGGDMEMAALTQFDMLPSIIELCVLKPDFCGLKSDESLLMSRLANESHRPQRLIFHQDGGLFEFNYDPPELSIRNDALDEESILALVFRGYAKFLVGPHESIDGMAVRLFRGRTWQFQSLNLGSDQSLEVFTFDGQSLLLLQEAKHLTVDLSALASRALGCEQPVFLAVDRLRQVSEGFSAEVTWQCDRQYYAAELLGQRGEREAVWSFKVYRRREVAPAVMADFLSGRSEVSLTSARCERILTDPRTISLSPR